MVAETENRQQITRLTGSAWETVGRLARRSIAPARFVTRVVGQTALSSLTRRILILNLAALIALVGGILYLNKFRAGLIDARVESLRTQGQIIAAAVAAQATARGLGTAIPFLVTPGSERVRATIARDGQMAALQKVGGTVLANACGPCIGQWRRSQNPTTEPNTIVTSFNRNFPGRNDGATATQNYIASPEIVTALALAGRLTFNPLTDTLTGADGKPFKLTPPRPAPEVPAGGFAAGRAAYVAPPADGSAVTVTPAVRTRRPPLPSDPVARSVWSPEGMDDGIVTAAEKVPAPLASTVARCTGSDSMTMSTSAPGAKPPPESPTRWPCTRTRSLSSTCRPPCSIAMPRTRVISSKPWVSFAADSISARRLPSTRPRPRVQSMTAVATSVHRPRREPSRTTAAVAIRLPGSTARTAKNASWAPRRSPISSSKAAWRARSCAAPCGSSCSAAAAPR